MNLLIKQLLNIQNTDLSIFDTKKQIEEIYKNILLINKEKEISEILIEQQKLKNFSLEEKQNNLNNLIQKLEKIIAKQELQQLSVKKIEEFNYLNFEIQKNKNRLIQEENNMLNLFEIIDKEKKTIEETKQRLKILTLESIDKINVLICKKEKLENQLLTLKANYKLLMSSDKKNYLYEKIKNTINVPPFIVPINNEKHCKGCYIKVSSEKYINLIKFKELQQCDQCNRILYISN